METIHGGKQNGYSLIEVVVAVAIAGISLAALLQALQGNAERSALSREYVTATTYGESMLARVGRDITVDAGTEHGQFGDAFDWTRTIRPYRGGTHADTPGGPAPVLPYEVIVTVSWRSGGKQHDLALRSLRLKLSQESAG